MMLRHGLFAGNYIRPSFAWSTCDMKAQQAILVVLTKPAAMHAVHMMKHKMTIACM